MTITYIRDQVFHETVSKIVAAACPNGSNVDPESIDQTVTETLLESGIWPNSWGDLMTDIEKASLVNRIVLDRRTRVRVPAVSVPHPSRPNDVALAATIKATVDAFRTKPA
jgi:hypothetical protein